MNTSMNRKGKNNKSLCEKSMKMVANFVRLSSFSIDKMSLTTPPPPPPPTAAGKHQVLGSFNIGFNDPPRSVGSLPWRLKSQEPQRSSKAKSYLLEALDEGNTNTFVVSEEESVDGKASEYIRKVHEKNRNNSDETSNLGTYIMPPPPLIRM
ncbi:hypothetical protein Pfo_020684 [Paulownia fortunei]|nr:hypothetical protein Pfo_020684 [Paulownia fortunei]